MMAVGGVAAGKVGGLLQVMGNTFFNQNISKQDVPSKQTCLRFASIGSALASIQICEAITKGQNFTFSIDGTSRDGKRDVGT